MKYYYTDYVRHCLRFFSKFPDEPPEFCSEADERDYRAAQTAMSVFAPDVRGAVIDYYSARTPNFVISNSVIRDVERRTAIERGLK
ncbi:MAG: hypothetical protein LUD47_03095 [Clostridia bacterium]|nr:hypothetical protein [Clostridia bacterium]